VIDVYRNPAAHPGKSCSAECGEFGCSRWTAVDDEVLRRRDEAKHAASHANRGLDPLDGPHVPYPQEGER
jgi:hypothetical protein